MNWNVLNVLKCFDSICPLNYRYKVMHKDHPDRTQQLWLSSLILHFQWPVWKTAIHRNMHDIVMYHDIMYCDVYQIVKSLPIRSPVRQVKYDTVLTSQSRPAHISAAFKLLLWMQTGKKPLRLWTSGRNAHTRLVRKRLVITPDSEVITQSSYVEGLVALLSYRGQCSDWPAAAWIYPAGSSPAPSWVVHPMHSGLRCEPPVGWWDELGEFVASAALSELWPQVRMRESQH